MLAFVFAWLAISLSFEVGALCVPQSTAEYAASVGSFVAAIGAIVLVINMTTMLLAWIEYNDARIKAAMLFAVVGLGSTTLWITYETQCRIPAVMIAFERGTPNASKEVSGLLDPTR